MIGQATRGKGVANGQVKLEDGSLLFVTVVEWLNASGQSLRGQGIQPDQVVLDDRFATPLDVRVEGVPNTGVALRIGKLAWNGRTDAKGHLERELIQSNGPRAEGRPLQQALIRLRRSLR